MPADEGDKSTVLHVYNVENFYAAVVEAYIQWQTALVKAVVRASLSGDTTMYLRGHQLCIRRLASLLPVASAHRHGQKWRCECNCCLFMWGLRNYCAHHWARDGAAFAISGGRWRSGSLWSRQHNARFDDNRGDLRTHAPQVHIPASQDVEEAPPVRRGGPRARRRRPEVQPGTRRRRLHAVPVGQLRPLARRESGAGAGRPRAQLPAHRTAGARQGDAAGVGGARTGRSRSGRWSLKRPRFGCCGSQGPASAARIWPETFNACRKSTDSACRLPGAPADSSRQNDLLRRRGSGRIMRFRSHGKQPVDAVAGRRRVLGGTRSSGRRRCRVCAAGAASERG